MQTLSRPLLSIPPASEMPEGSIVLMSVNGTQKDDLVKAHTFWLVSAAVLGLSLGWYLRGRR